MPQYCPAHIIRPIFTVLLPPFKTFPSMIFLLTPRIHPIYNPYLNPSLNTMPSMPLLTLRAGKPSRWTWAEHEMGASCSAAAAPSGSIAGATAADVTVVKEIDESSLTLDSVASDLYFSALLALRSTYSQGQGYRLVIMTPLEFGGKDIEDTVGHVLQVAFEKRHEK